MTDPDLPVPADAGRSWWLLEALARPEFEGEPAPPLESDTTADVVILGGGYTGLWTALHLKELDPGADVVILEQDICGGGPSGRNGGFVSSFWEDLPHLAEAYGDEMALRICRVGDESVAAIGAFCEANGIEAWFRADGALGVATSETQVGAWADLVITADRLGVGGDLEVLDAPAARARVDSPVVFGGVFSPHGAIAQPARLARGMRRVAMERGVRIFEGSPVTRFGAGAPSVAETPGGSVRAGAAVLALNAWAARMKRFRRAITVRGSYIVMTAPAPEKLEALGWTDGLGISDYRAALHYLRTTPDGRIAFGIGGMQPNLARTIGPRFAYDEHAIRVAIDDLHRMFPTFQDVPIEAGWGGPIDVSGAHLPFFGTFENGAVHYGLGYTGNGVGPAHFGGRILALRALGRYEAVLDLPFVDADPLRFPPEPIKSPGALIANTAIRRKDEFEDRGQAPNPLVDFVARLPRRLGYHLGP
ncbi:MAG: NAD(P)/FAD-dependent oxidoreductase [Actinomycetota bacterium]